MEIDIQKERESFDQYFKEKYPELYKDVFNEDGDDRAIIGYSFALIVWMEKAKAQPIPECKWSKNQGGFYDTSCTNAFVFPESDDTPEYHEFTHCPFCGGKLSEPQEST